MKKTIASIMTTLAIASSMFAMPAFAGGSNNYRNLVGSWNGMTNFLPGFEYFTNMTLTQDASGNLTGTFCTQYCAPVNGKWRNAFQFELRIEGSQLVGWMNDPITCSDGSIGNWVNGSVQTKGSIGTFSYTTCAN
jgi:hypothetical protein